MHSGGRQIGLAPPVPIVCLTMFVRPTFASRHENMFGYLPSSERSSFLSLSVICVNWEQSLTELLMKVPAASIGSPQIPSTLFLVEV